MSPESNNPSVNDISSLLIPHLSFVRASERIQQCFSDGAVSSDPACLAIVGESRTGKSRVLEYVHNHHPRHRDSEGLTVPILRIKVPSKPTVKGMVGQLLYTIGDPHFDRGTEHAKTNRLRTLIRHCGTKLLMLDEFNHFVDKSTSRVQFHAADWLKVLVDDTRIGLVVAGLPYCIKVIDENEQLARRFSAPIRLNRFDWTVTAQRREFIQILAAIQGALPVWRFPDLSDRDIAFRMYCATGGLIGYVIRLLKASMWIAQTADTSTITFAHLARAQVEEIWNTEESAVLSAAFTSNQFRPTATRLNAARAVGWAPSLDAQSPPTRKPRHSKRSATAEALRA